MKSRKGGQPYAVSVVRRPQPHIGISFRQTIRNRFQTDGRVGAGSGSPLIA